MAAPRPCDNCGRKTTMKVGACEHCGYKPTTTREVYQTSPARIVYCIRCRCNYLDACKEHPGEEDKLPT